MKLLVNVNKITLDEKDKLNAGEYNIHEVEFAFSDEYNGLVKKATFSTKNHSYLVDLPNSTCIIPYEVLEETGDFEIGAFGYDTNGDELVLRYSPSPTYVHVDLGSYRENFDNYKVPTADVIEQLTERIEEAEQTVEGYDDRLTIDENKLETVEEGAEVNIIEDVKVNGASLEVVDKSVNIPVPTKVSDLDNDTGFITNTVNDLTNYTTTTNMNIAINNAVNGEKELRQQADVNLQNQIDAITSATDVVDVVGTYQELQDYDTSKLTDKDVIKVLQDSTHNNALSYYRWAINGTGSWNYVGSEGPFYTKGETDTLLNAKQDTIDASHKLSADYVDDTLTTNKFTNTSEKATWNAKYDKPSTGIPKTDLSSEVQTSLGKADTAIQDVSDKEDKSNKVTSISSSSTDVQYPSAKLLNTIKTSLETEDTKIKGVLNNLYDLESYLFEEQSVHETSDQSITLNNTMKKAPMKLELKGNTSQTGTPTPDTPLAIHTITGDNEVVVRGKNLFDGKFYTGVLQPQTDYTNTNLNRTLNYSDLNSKYYTFGGYFPAGTYTFSIQKDNYYISLNRKAIAGESCVSQSMAVRNSFTWTQEVNGYTYFSIERDASSSVLTDINFDGTDFMLMANVGDTALTYKPYQSQTYPINLPVENLLDISDITSGNGITNNGDGSITLQGGITSNSFSLTTPFVLKANQTYTLSITNTNSSYSASTFILRNESTNIIVINYSQSSVNYTPTQDTTIDTLRIFNGGSTFNNFTFYPQLEVGSKQNKWQPYGQTPIELCKIGDYQDLPFKAVDTDDFYKTLDSATKQTLTYGKWYLHKEIGKVVLNGSENWQKGSNTHQFYLAKPTNMYPVSPMLINYFVNQETASNNGMWASTNFIQANHLSYTIVSDFKTWLSTHNTTLYYVLATPTNEEITDTNLISQLDNIENAMSYEGTTNISQVNNDKAFIIDITAIQKL